VSYIDVPIETEPVDLAQDAFGYIEQQVPGWLPSPGNLEAWLIEAVAQLAGELRDLCQLVPDSIFEYFGSSVLALPPYAAQAAVGSTNWTMIDAAGYTVVAGTLVGISPPGVTDIYAYETVADFTVPAGQTTATAVQIRAIEAGAAASGVTGTVQMLDPIDYVASIALTAPTSGGVDEEASDDYLNRLSNLLTLLSPRPILPQDFAVLVQSEVPAVARATAIDLWNNSTSTGNQPRCTTVALCDVNGNPCAAADKNTALALLQNAREVNFLVFVADPAYTTFDVAFTVIAYPGYVAADVANAVVANLTAYLSPQNWGVPPYGDTSGRSWVNDTTLRYLELSQVVNQTDGVHYVQTLTFAKAGQTKGTADITMTGVAPLPKPGAISGTAQVET
jgi:hypothetical protein